MNYSEAFTAMLDNDENGIGLTYSKDKEGSVFSISLGYNASDGNRWELTLDEADKLNDMLERFIEDKEVEENKTCPVLFSQAKSNFFMGDD